MKYELWEMKSYTMNEPTIPFMLLYKSDVFEKIYTKFKEVIKITPCVIFIKSEENKPKIYESPDKGKTIYERDFGNYDHKRRIK